MSKLSEASIGTQHRFVYGVSRGQPYPNALVEVVSKPFSGNYKAQGQVVKIGTCVRVRHLGEHNCTWDCSRNHEINARLDQLTPEAE